MKVWIRLLYLATAILGVSKALYAGVNTCVTVKKKATAAFTEALLYFAGRNHMLLM